MANGMLTLSKNARLAAHSRHSLAAWASAVMPLPMPQRTVLAPCTTSVRMGTLKVARTPPAPSLRTTPAAPQYQPRGAVSSAAMAAMLLRLGAPVMEPQGNSA